MKFSLPGSRLAPKDNKEAVEQTVAAHRQLAIAYKETFKTEFGRTVMLDLMNRFYFMKPRPQGSDLSHLALIERGHREVVEDLLGKANVDLVAFDKKLRGEI